MNIDEESIVLIFGGSGFIGSSIIQYLLGNLKKNKIFFPTRKECNLENKNNILSYLNQFKKEKLQVIFCAGIVRKKNDTSNAMKKNIEIVDNFLNSFNINNLDSLIFMSSIDVYDTSNVINKISEKSKIFPSSYYGLSKYNNENSIKEVLKQAYTTILRLPGVYGGDKYSLIDIFLDKIYSNEIIELENEGKNLRDFLFIEDLCEVVKELLLNPKRDIFNVSSGNSTSIIEIIRHIEELIKKKANLKLKDNPYNNKDIIISNKSGCLWIGIWH